MKRKVRITIEDEDSKTKISGSIEVDQINELYKKHGMNGVSLLFLELNRELNDKLNEECEVLIPNELTTLPDGKKW